MNAPLIPWTDDPFAGDVLDFIVHDRLVKHKDKFSAASGVPSRYIWCPDDRLSACELEWARAFNRNKQSGILGLAYVGKFQKLTVEERFFRLAGKLLRNFVNARVMQMDQIMAARNEGYPEVTCLFVPTLCEVRSDPVKGTSAASLLLDRFSKPRQQTIIHFESWSKLRDYHGTLVHDHVKQHFTELGDHT